MIWNLIFGALPGLATAVLGHFEKKADRELDAFKTGAEIDRQGFRDWLSANVENNRTKLAAMGWWGAKVIILIAGIPASLNMAAIFLDSLPFWIPLFMKEAHAIGSWGVPKPPAPYDGYQRDIVLSFFIVMPAMPVVGALAQWLGRKR